MSMVLNQSIFKQNIVASIGIKRSIKTDQVKITIVACEFLS